MRATRLGFVLIAFVGCLGSAVSAYAQETTIVPEYVAEEAGFATIGSGGQAIDSTWGTCSPIWDATLRRLRRLEAFPWTFGADGVMMTRSGARQAVLARDQVGRERLNTDSLAFGYEPGFHFNGILHTRSRWDFEVDFTMVDAFRLRRSVTGTGLRLDGPGMFFAGGREAVATYDSSLYSTELNVRRRSTSWITPLMGFRWIEIHEDFQMSLPITGAGYVPGTVGAIDTLNHLYGFQIGADMLLSGGDRLQVETAVKAGIFGNHIGQSSSARLNPHFVLSETRLRDGHLSFLGDLKVSLKYLWSESITIRGGYQMLWFEGIALAAEQFNNTNLSSNTSTIDTNGSPLYHGAFLGVEIAR